MSSLVCWAIVLACHVIDVIRLLSYVVDHSKTFKATLKVDVKQLWSCGTTDLVIAGLLVLTGSPFPQLLQSVSLSSTWMYLLLVALILGQFLFCCLLICCSGSYWWLFSPNLTLSLQSFIISLNIRLFLLCFTPSARFFLLHARAVKCYMVC